MVMTGFRFFVIPLYIGDESFEYSQSNIILLKIKIKAEKYEKIYRNEHLR